MDEAPKPLADDATLIARAQAGEAEAFGELYRRYLDPIYRYLRVRTGDAQEAEDLAEAVFLRAFQALGRYRERGWPFSAFLYQTARNALVDHYRSQREVVALDQAAEEAAGAEALDEQVERRQQLEQVRTGLDRLKPDHREVIILRVVLELPTATVARWMQRSEGAIRVLLFRALEALRREIGGELDGE